MLTITTGGRDYYDRAMLYRTMEEAHNEAKALKEELIVLHGDCGSGADYLVKCWCEQAGVEQWKFPANWKRNGKAAGPLRNARMLSVGCQRGISCVIAFPGGAGTTDMVKRASAARVTVARIGEGWKE